MNKIDKIQFRTIKRISPSQFYSMKNCAYKSLLAEAFEKKPLLPVSPAAYLGTVLHKILEFISKGIIKDNDDLNEQFDNELKKEEEKLKQIGYGFFIPLQKNVRDFGIKKVLLKKHLKDTPRSLASEIRFQSEKWVESKDHSIAGKIDLVIEDEGEAEIIDFKTGAITQDVLDDSGEAFSDVKEEYKQQLKLYAYLYFENMGRFPKYLSLVDLAKQKFAIDFSPSECIAVFEEAKKLLDSVNESILTGLFVANPSEANCKYCLYRPACSFFLNQIQSDYSFNDVAGTIRNVLRYQNGNVSVFLESGAKNVTITNFPSEKYYELNESRNRPIAVFNLRKEATECVYSVTKTTMIYEQ